MLAHMNIDWGSLKEREARVHTAVDLVRWWHRHKKGKGVRTVDEWRRDLLHYFVPAFSALGDPSEITYEHAQHWVDVGLRKVKSERTGRPLSPRRIRNIVNMTRSMFTDARKKGALVCESNPFTDLELPRNEDRDPEWREGAAFTTDEIATILSSDKIPTPWRVVYAIQAIGLREGEGIQIQWKDVRLADRKIVVSQAVHAGVLGPTKTRATYEYVIHEAVVPILLEWKTDGWAAEHGRLPADEDLVTPRRDEETGELVFRRGDYTCKRFQFHLKKLGLRKRRLHDLRAAFSTLTKADGAPDYVIEAILHPKQYVSTIAGMYTRVPWNLKVESVNKWRLVL